MVPVQRPICSRIILTKEVGENMQQRYESLYKRVIRGRAKNDSLVSDITNLRNLLTAIQNQDVIKIDGFCIHLGLDSDGILFLFQGITGLNSTGHYFRVVPGGNDYEIVDDISAGNYIGSYATEILTLPEIKNGLLMGNTRTYVYAGRLVDFLIELIRQDRSSPVQNIKIKLSAYTNPKYTEYTDRLVVGFSFMEGMNEIHLTDVAGEYGCNLPVNHPLDGLGADTGTPCPPNKNCPTKELSQEYN